MNDADLADFVLSVTTTDPDEQSLDEPQIPIDPGMNTGEVELGLERPPRGRPFDVAVGLRHRRGSARGGALAEGSYDYPVPGVALDPPSPIPIPVAAGVISACLTLTPPKAQLCTAELRIPSFGLSFSGTAAAADSHGRVTLTFPPDAEQWRSLEALEGLRPASLILMFKGVTEPITLDVAVERLTPPRLELLTLPRIRALTDRPARIAAHLRNQGGSDALVESVRWTASKPGFQAVTGEIAALAGRRLAAQAVWNDEWRPMMRDEDGAPLPVGHYHLEFAVAYRPISGPASSPPERLVQDLDVDVRPYEEFEGRVCIDFGTTDTAAALLPPGESYFTDPQHGQTPRSIELGPLTVPLETVAPRYFVPTRAAVGYGPDGYRVIAFDDDALRGASSMAHGRVIDRLKWRLNQGEPVSGFEDLTVETLVAEYLKHIRRLIEEHPDVAARVDQVVATRPARFGVGHTKRLVECFAAAGMTVDNERFGENARPMVSESWPPMLFNLPMRNTRLLQSLFARFPGEALPELLDIETLRQKPHYLCTFDIGGGSLDVSLLELRYEDHRIHVTDLAADTDVDFAGEGFRDLIVAELSAFSPGAPRSEIDPVGSSNLQALREAAFQIQNFPLGPFSFIRAIILDAYGTLLTMAAHDLDDVFGILTNGFRDISARTDEAKFFVRQLYDELDENIRDKYTLHFNLRSQNGTINPLLLESDTLVFLLLRITIRFFKTYSPLIAKLMSEFKQDLPRDGQDTPLQLLLTGRGSLFPLARQLIRACAKEHLGDPRVYEVSGEPAKAVTSWGAAALRASRETGGSLEFAGLNVAGYALYAINATGTEAYAPMRPIEGRDQETWGLPLSALDSAFDPHREIRVCVDLGPTRAFPEDVKLAGVDLKASRRETPGIWVLFEPDSAAIRFCEAPDGVGASDTGGAA